VLTQNDVAGPIVPLKATSSTSRAGALRISGALRPELPNPVVVSAFRKNYDFWRKKKPTALIEPRHGSFTLDWVYDSVQKSHEQIRVLHTLLLDCGYRSRPSGPQYSQLFSKLCLYNLADLGESFLKWKTGTIAALCFKQTEVPERPDFVLPEERGDVLIGGSAACFTRMLIHQHSYHFGWNVSQVKKGMPLGTDTYVKAALEKAKKALTSTRSRPGPSVHEESLRQAARTTRELYKDGWYSPQQPQIPSISGHFFTTRKNGGALQALATHRLGALEEKLVTYVRIPIPKVQYSAHWARQSALSAARADAERKILALHRCLACMTHRPISHFCDRCGWVPSDSIVTVQEESSITHHVDDTLSYDADPQLSHSQWNMVRCVGLKEPFKVRVITGGPEGKYFRSKYIQKAIHSHLRKHPCARLIGEVITPERLNSSLLHPRSHEFYVSGDYSAATDNLDPEISEIIARTISSQAHWDSEWENLFVDTLVNHRIHMRGRPDHSVENNTCEADSLPQKWGQLMGSPTSFPVLCIANLSATRHALELNLGRVLTLEETGILINGDDIGFVTDAPGYELWKQTTTNIGLSPSIGKNFISKDFIVLNSTFYDISGEGQGRTLTYRPYINYGLQFCRNENGTPIDEPQLSISDCRDPRTPSIGDLARDLIKGHPEDTQLRLLKRFVAAWQPHLNRFCPRGMSYWLPRHLGGLGLPVVGEFVGKEGRSRYSRMQLVVAAHLASDPERQSQLTRYRGAKNDSVQLWNMILPEYDELLSPIL
jgi:hypothetical protein